MAMPVQAIMVGVDVSKRTLDVCVDGTPKPQRIANEPQAIRDWLASLWSGPVCLAVEATNVYHLDLVQQAHEAGHRVYLVDGYRLSRYRDSIGTRAKTDAGDAQLLLRYLRHEQEHLRPWSPPPAGYLALQRLLSRRAKLIQARVALQQSLADMPELKRAGNSIMRALALLDRKIQQLLIRALQRAGWQGEAERLQAIEGIGPLTSAALTMAFHRGAFRDSDAFVAFMGLDVRVRDSGQLRGRRRLTKKGSPELRRLLYLAAMHAGRTAAWKDYYQRYLDRGFAKIQALVILARKLARVAFALLRSGSEYQPKHPQEACPAT